MKADLPLVEILMARARQRIACVTPADGAREAIYAQCRRELEDIPMASFDHEVAAKQLARICGV